MKLSRNFTLEEMMATSHGKLQDMPTGEVILNLTFLCARVLQPLRDAIGRPVYINSGYRSKSLNARVGGVPNSYHLRGLAADIHVDNDEHAKVLFDILRQRREGDWLAARADTHRRAAAQAGGVVIHIARHLACRSGCFVAMRNA